MATSTVKTPSKQTAGPSASGQSLPARQDLLPQLQAQDNEGGSIDELSVFIQANFACQHFKERDRNELLVLLEIGKQADALREGTRDFDFSPASRPMAGPLRSELINEGRYKSWDSSSKHRILKGDLLEEAMRLAGIQKKGARGEEGNNSFIKNL